MDNQFEQTRKYWGSELSRGNLIYPNNQVIRFVKRNFKANRDITILDFGCGAGRNTIALFNEGFNVIAMDYTDTAIEMTREKLKRIGISDSAIIKNKGFEIPLDCNSIDAVIADGSLFYYPKKDITKILSNLFAVMKPEALLWCDFRTKQDSLFARGIPLSDGLFRLESGTDREGCAYYFADESDIKEIFTDAGFTVVSIDDYTYSENNHQIVNSWYHVIAQKEMNNACK